MKNRHRRISSVALAVSGMVSLFACAGCHQRAPGSNQSASPPEPVYHEIARVHWLGAQKVAADTNAAYLAGICALPEAAELLAQTLGKLAEAPWRDLGTNRPAPEQTSALLRPLLEDLVRAESHLRIRQSSNSPAEAALAIRLPQERQGLWSTNLSAVVQSLVSNAALSRQTNSGWNIPWGSSSQIRFDAADPWAVVSFGISPGPLVTNLLTQLRRDAGQEQAGSNDWATVELDLASLLPLLKVDAPGLLLPHVSATVRGDGEYVRSQGELKFPSPLPIKVEPWQIPTNFIREPLISFTAAQGFEPWLERLGWVQKHNISRMPNQLFLWALNLTDVHTFAAAPLTNSASVIDGLGEQLEGEWNAWITNNALGFADYSAPNHGIAWTALPMVTPAFQALPSAVGDVVFARLAPSLPPPGEYAPAELISMVSSRTNTLYYDWEITEARLKHWIFLGQSIRMAFHRAQMPPDCKSVAFLQAITPKLGNSITELSLLDPSTLRFTRKSHLGLTAFELHLLADWLESPAYPRGLHSTLAPPPPLMRWRAKTRSFETTTNISPAIHQP